MSESRLTTIGRNITRALVLIRQLAQRKASFADTLRAHRFLFSINYAGRHGELAALRRFEKSGYTYDDLAGALWFARAHGAGGGFGAEGIHRMAWAATEGRAEARSVSGLLPAMGEGTRLENVLLGHCTLVVSATLEVARQACRILKETGVGGEIVPVDVFDEKAGVSVFRTVASVRARCVRGGLKAPPLRVIAVLSDPIAACATEWGKIEGGRVDMFETQLEKAAEADPASLFSKCFQHAVDGPELVRRAGLLLGESELGNLTIDPDLGFAERETASGRCFVARLECLHVVGLHLKSEAQAPVPPFGLQDPRAIEPGPAVLETLQLAPPVLERIAEKSSGILEDRSAWIEKWSPLPEGSRALYVFPHIPKTAGSSLAHHFREQLKGYGQYVHVRHDTDEAGIRRDRSLPFYWRDARLRSLAKVIFGHGVKRRFRDYVPGTVTREIITLREPAERMVSHYNFWMHIHERRGLPVVSFDDWYSKEPRNYQVFWIAHNYLEMDFWLYSQETLHRVVDDLLEEFWMVSTLKTFDRDMQLLMREIGLPEVGERKNVGGGDRFKKLISLTDDLRARLREENAFEYRLYEKWLERAKARHGEPSIR